jgi:putative solute:sodium symporter small subunit
MPSSPASDYWRRSNRLVLGLLVVWFAVSFGAGILFVDPLNEIKLGGFPLGFWFAQQGSILVFIVLIAIYCVTMDRMDKEAQSPEADQ